MSKVHQSTEGSDEIFHRRVSGPFMTGYGDSSCEAPVASASEPCCVRADVIVSVLVAQLEVCFIRRRAESSFSIADAVSDVLDFTTAAIHSRLLCNSSHVTS